MNLLAETKNEKFKNSSYARNAVTYKNYLRLLRTTKKGFKVHVICTRAIAHVCWCIYTCEHIQNRQGQQMFSFSYL